MINSCNRSNLNRALLHQWAFCDLPRARIVSHFAIWPYRLGGRIHQAAHEFLRRLMRLYKRTRTTTHRLTLPGGCKIFSFPVLRLTTGMQCVWHSRLVVCRCLTASKHLWKLRSRHSALCRNSSFTAKGASSERTISSSYWPRERYVKLYR